MDSIAISRSPPKTTCEDLMLPRRGARLLKRSRISTMKTSVTLTSGVLTYPVETHEQPWVRDLLARRADWVYNALARGRLGWVEKIPSHPP